MPQPKATSTQRKIAVPVTKVVEVEEYESEEEEEDVQYVQDIQEEAGEDWDEDLYEEVKLQAPIKAAPAPTVGRDGTVSVYCMHLTKL